MLGIWRRVAARHFSALAIWQLAIWVRPPSADGLTAFVEAGQTWWQALPVGPTGYADSP